MASKTFRVAVQSNPVEFTLEYTAGPDRKPTSKTFHCRPTVPLGLILEFASISNPDETESAGKAMKMIEELYEAAIVADEFPAFKALLDDPDAGIDIEMYSEIAGWLAGEYTARPTGENSESSSPAPSSGTASTAGASPETLTYFRPEPVAATH